MNTIKKSLDYSLFLLTGTVLFQALFFLLGMGVSVIPFVLATLLFFVFSYYFNDRRKIRKTNILAVVIVWAVIILLFLYYRQFNECTYDGAYYHGNAMVNMLNGWNPFYEADNYLNTGVTVWADYYPKATWMFSACLIKLFDHLSAGMIISAFTMIIVAFYGFQIVYDKNGSLLLASVTGFLLFINPIAIEQLHTYYVDAILGNLTIILLILCYKAMKEYKIWDNILIVVVSVFMINIKFTGFGFAGIVNLVAWLYLLFNDRESFWKYTVSGVIMVLIAVCVVGFSPYLVNIMKMRHIFYPIAGKNAEDVVTYLIPEQIKTYNSYHKLTYSLTAGLGLKANLRDFSAEEYLLYDERIGALGKQFLKMLILASIGFGVAFISQLKKKNLDLPLWLSIVALLGTIIANYSNMWWLRYIPQIWAFVPLGVLLLAKKKYLSIIGIIILVLAVNQNTTIYKNTYDTDLAKSRSIEKFYHDYEGKSPEVLIKAVNGDEVYWFDDYEVERAKRNGVEIAKVKHDMDAPAGEPYYMHYYVIYVLGGK